MTTQNPWNAAKAVSKKEVWLFWFVTKSCLTLATPWTVACQTSLSIGFSRKEYWSGLPFPSLGNLPDPGIESASPGSGRFPREGNVKVKSLSRARL